MARAGRGVISELDRAVLVSGVLEQKLRAGDVGTVVMVYRDGEAFEVEFLTLGGDTRALATLPASALRLAEDREVAHARQLA